MAYSDEDIQRDIERVKRIPIITTLLNVICETTGMGFAAVARVTDHRWITCSVRDDINFGLVPGSELQIETTICNEIRDNRQPVIIDHVKESELFSNHHTPLMYGFQSYISFPIIEQNGAFFGTICAIDPKPQALENSAVVGMFAAFAELISFHLQQTELLADRGEAVYGLNRDLTHFKDENRQYQHLSSHTLQEPLRKLVVFSGMLVDAVQEKQLDEIENLAQRIKRAAEKFSHLIKDLTDFSKLNKNPGLFQQTSLTEVINRVASQLQPQLLEKSATVAVDGLPALPMVPDQIEKLFYHLFDNAIKFSKPDVPLEITVSNKVYVPQNGNEDLSPDKSYIEIIVSDNGIGIDPSQLERIFDVFSQLPTEIFAEGVGTGLSFSRKVVRNHLGQISITSAVGMGTNVSIVLPVN